MVMERRHLALLIGCWMAVSASAARATEHVYYFHNDHLGTPQAMSDAAGRTVWTAEYDPFGKATVNQDPDDDGQIVVNNLRFRGQYYDAETGLHYNWNRYYDPGTGRFLTPDPIGLEGGLNLYPYADNNPVRYVDPDGLTAALPWPAALPAAEGALGALIGAIAGAKTAEQFKDMCDPCKPYEKECIGIAKNVLKHLEETSGLPRHPGPCKTLELSIIRAGIAGCIDRPGVQFGVTVYNQHCTRDWSGKYPEHTPHFPPFPPR
jgi:RHS repeat-associated protein